MNRAVLIALGGLSLSLGACSPDNTAGALPLNFAPQPQVAPGPEAYGEAPTAVNKAAREILTAPGADPGRDELLADVRTRKLRNEDFAESDTNRDPFRSFLADFSAGPIIDKQYIIYCPKYSIDELKFSMIVGPPTTNGKNGARVATGAGHVEPRAMFIDPTGLGCSVVRGQHMSKSDAHVVRIEPDKGKVFLEIKEDLGGGKSRMVERVLELHQGELNNQGNQ